MTNPIDLNPNYLATVRRILAEHVPACEVRAYGSRATWTAKDYSDLDLAVVGGESLDRITLGRLKEAFEESDLPMRVDVLDWHSISESFRHEIKRDFAVVQEAGDKQTAVAEWREGTWGEIATLEYGKSLRGYKSSKGPYRVYGTNGPIGWHTEMLCPHPSVIIGRKGAYRGVHYSSTPFFAIDTAFYLKPKTEIDARWAYYQLLTQDINGMDSGSAIPSTSRNDFYSLSVKIPPLPEQRAIAHILGTLDDKIELNRRMNETLEEMARALFKSWFVDFDPVRAKMEGRWRRGESLPGLPAEHYDLFPDRLVPSELGEIPEGWEVKTLGEIAVQRRKGIKPETIHPDTPYIALEHMPKRCIALSEWGTAEGLASSKFSFEKGDILYGKLRPYFHKVGVAPFKGVCSTDIVVITAKSPDWFAFVLAHTSSNSFVDYTDATSTGTRMPRTKWADMASYKVVLPSDQPARAFNDIVRPWISQMLLGIRESRALAPQRDSLLPRLVSGLVGVEPQFI